MNDSHVSFAFKAGFGLMFKSVILVEIGLGNGYDTLASYFRFRMGLGHVRDKRQFSNFVNDQRSDLLGSVARPLDVSFRRTVGLTPLGPRAFVKCSQDVPRRLVGRPHPILAARQHQAAADPVALRPSSLGMPGRGPRAGCFGCLKSLVAVPVGQLARAEAQAALRDAAGEAGAGAAAFGTIP